MLAPRSVEDFKASIFSIDTKKIHEFDQIDLHKETGEPIFSSLTSSAKTVSKLQSSLNNINSSFKIEKISSFSNDNRIKFLEYLIINLGHEPKDIKATEELIKNKEVDMQALRKQMKLPSTENPQDKEVANIETKKEKIFTIVILQNAQI